MPAANLARQQYLPDFNPLQIKIDEFSGPLDLLLELIKSKKKEVKDVSLASICEPYLEYLKNRQNWNLTHDAEFVEIASTLIFIKSKALLPASGIEEEGESVIEIEQKLKFRLAEHQEYRRLGAIFNSKVLLNRDFFSRNAPTTNKAEVVVEANIIELISAFREVIEKEQAARPYHYEQSSWDVALRITELENLLRTNNYLSFFKVCQVGSPEILVLTLMAMLEMARLQEISIIQDTNFADILCYKTDSAIPL